MINPAFIYEPNLALSETLIATIAMMLTLAPLLNIIELAHKKMTIVRDLFGSVSYTGLITHETNPYQCSPERRNSGCHGRWPATLRSGHRNTLAGTEKGQRL